jgi:tagaturonate reductase
MKNISRAHLNNIGSPAGLTLPAEALFELPEKVIQFGTGAFLRGLPDFLINKANRQGVFNGRIVLVKSTDSGDAGVFELQDNLYTLCVRGIEDGKVVEEDILCSPISRVLSAKKQWLSVLDCARNPDIGIVISNTTEVGIKLVQDDIGRCPPVSFPGKLVAFLYERYKAFGGDQNKGMVIVPTELIPDNGKELEAIVLELAYRNGLEDKFLEWVEKHNYFCNSLVDRIVPGRPDDGLKLELEQKFGYRDDLMIMAESYRLWAIEGDEHVKSVLSFYRADESVKIEPSIDKYRELKLRLLNGTHTLSCGLAFLAGFPTVKEAMQDAAGAAFITNLMMGDLVPAIPYQVSEKASQRFGMSVLDRFRNPYVDHQWINITLEYSYKMKMRNIPTLINYCRVFGCVPQYVALGFAAYLLFMKATKREGEQYWGDANGQPYPIKDEKAGYFYQQWNGLSAAELVTAVLSNKELWDEDLTLLPGFSEAVTQKLQLLLDKGALQTLQSFIFRSAFALWSS